MKKNELNRMIEEVRKEAVDPAVVAAAAERVRAGLRGGEVVVPVALEGCRDFSSLIPAYLAKTLPAARVMLFEDHVQSCVECRRAVWREKGLIEAPRVVEAPRQRAWAMPAWSWAAAAAALAVVAVSGLLMQGVIRPAGARATVASAEGTLFRLTDGRLVPLKAGDQLGEREEVRAAKASRGFLRLADGSSVELGERAAISVSRTFTGSTIQLAGGNIIVEAARQKGSFLGVPVRLRVASGDCTVTVKGTIFAVARGLKGSRVSVVEGEVKVDRPDKSETLVRGGLSTPDGAAASASVAEDIAWSKEQAKYLALLGELAHIERKIAELPGPSNRYETRLMGRLPAGTAFYVAIPNLGQTLADATRLFEDRVRESEVLREWWNDARATEMRAAVERVKTFSDFLGDEIVIAASLDGAKGLGEPVILAEVRKPGLKAYMDSQLGLAKLAGAGPQFDVRDNVVAAGGSRASIEGVLRGSGGFASTAYGKRLAEAYANGAGWIFSADLEQIVRNSVGDSKTAKMTGLDTAKYLIVERHDTAGRTENRATLTFDGARGGIASWLGNPGALGSLEFVSPDAAFATSIVIKNPASVVSELIAQLNSNGVDTRKALDEFRARTGVDLQADLAASLGGEITVALDGALLPPAFKIVAEVYDQTRFAWCLEQLIKAVNSESQGQAAATLTQETVGGRVFYTVRSPQLPVEVHYTFADGYWIAGPSNELLSRSIAQRAAGVSLSRSAPFQKLLPSGGRTGFSAIAYQNLAPAVGPLVDALKGFMTDAQKAAAAQLTANREPTLVYAYGEADRIVAASSGSFFGLKLDSLLTGRALPDLVANAFAAPRAASRLKK